MQRRDATSCSRSSRLLTAVLYSVSFAALGLCIASLGPALLELAIQTGSTLQYAGYCFGARSLGYLLGSFAGPAFDRFNGHVIMSLALALAGAGAFCTPFVRNVVVLGAVCTMQGVGMGISDSGCNVLLIYLFQQRSPAAVAPTAARLPDVGGDSASAQSKKPEHEEEII
ncbi:MFS transporter, partial [archaeon]